MSDATLTDAEREILADYVWCVLMGDDEGARRAIERMHDARPGAGMTRADAARKPTPSCWAADRDAKGRGKVPVRAAGRWTGKIRRTA
jgi:hypothetical protein